MYQRQEYIEMLKKIKESFQAENFDDNYFEFYQGRKNKSRFRAGIIKFSDKYFFKILDKEEYNDEDNINKEIGPFFKIMPRIGKLEFNNLIISLYDYIDAPRINSFNYLRDNNIPYLEKEKKYENYFNELIKCYNKNINIKRETQSSRGDRWFYSRYITTNRLENFYGKDCSILLYDIKNYSKEMYEEYSDFFTNVKKFLSSDRNTVYTYSHGDFHDFNFNLDGLYWDMDTFDNNPIINDFAVYYWHYCAREDYLIYKYSPWLTNYMYDNLDNNGLEKIRELKKEEISKLYSYIKNKFLNNNLDFDEEFKFKLFCRVFLVDNILLYEEEDKKLIYSYFYEMISNKNLENYLFDNKIIVKTIKK